MSHSPELNLMRRKTTFARLESKSNYGDVSIFDVNNPRKSLTLNKRSKVKEEEFKSFERLEECLTLGIRPIFPYPLMNFGKNGNSPTSVQQQAAANWALVYHTTMKQWPNADDDNYNKTEAVEILKAITKKNDNYRKFL